MRSIVVAVVAVAAVGSLAGSATPASADLSARDRCVRGTWKMSNAAATALLRDLTSPVGTSPLRVERGVITAAFPRTGSMRYGSTYFVVAADFGALVMRARGTFIYEASWSTRNGQLVVGRGRSELVISKFKATKDGRTVSVDGPPPSIKTVRAGATPYRCSRDTLRWEVPLNGSWAVFRRDG